MKEKLLFVMMALVALVILAGLGYGAWRLERGCHFEFGYREDVRAEVRAMVRPECLVEAK